VSRFTDRLAALFSDSPTYTLSDPALAEFLGMAGVWGANVSESQAMGLTPLFRAYALISGTIAGLPLKVYSNRSGQRTQVDHWLSSSPAGPYDLAGFNWVEMVVLHLLNHGEAFLRAVRNNGGQLIGFWPVHPLSVNKVTWMGSDKVFEIQLANGSTEMLTSLDVRHILGMSLDGRRGMSNLTLFRQSLQTTRAGEVAANRQFVTGNLIAGLVTTEEDVDKEEAQQIKDSLRAKMAGAEHAGDIAFVNRSLKFTPWTMSNADAEFIASRTFQVEEIARITGVPPHLLMSTDKQTSWGTGVSEQNQALHRYTLTAFTSRIESAINPAIAPLFCEFDYSGLLQGTPTEEIGLLIDQVKAGLLTRDEARAIRNLPPLSDQQKAELPAMTSTPQSLP
jgi:HK97 family phage portal protein